MEGYLNLVAVVSSLACLITLLFIRKLSPARRTLNLPPSPTALPVIGHLHLLGPSPHRALHKVSTRLGSVIHLRLGAVPCVVASGAGAAKEFLRTHDLSFSDRVRSKVTDCLNYGAAGGFIFAPYGDHWRRMRKLCVSELLGGSTLEQLRSIRREEVGRLFQTLNDKAEKRQEVDVGAELVKLTSNVILRMVMGKGCFGTDGEALQVKKLMEDASELMGKFNLADFLGFCKNLDLQGFQKRAEDVQRRFDGMMEGIIEEREDLRRRKKETACDGDHALVRKDLLDMLLDISQVEEGADKKLTREDVKIFLRDIFAGGTDNAAVTMEWVLAELINHPAILEKARGEIDSVVGDARMVEESDIPSLPFLQAVVKETMRLHPAAPLLTRHSSGPCRVMGYDFPAKTMLLVNLWAIGRDPDQWEDPLEFRPERFLEGGRSAGVEARGQHFQLLPFGSGRRVCPGISLALQLMLPTIGAMIQCFHWLVDQKGGVVDMEEGRGFIVSRLHPLVCTPAARLPNPLPLP